MSKRNSVIGSDEFLATAKRIMGEDERAAIVDLVAQEPEAGVRLQGAPGVRKLRVPLTGRGKRGGARIIYWFHSEDYPAVLLLAYAKNQAANLKPEQARRLATIAGAIMEDLAP